MVVYRANPVSIVKIMASLELSLTTASGVNCPIDDSTRLQYIADVHLEKDCAE
jgi:hypothetical protein